MKKDIFLFYCYDLHPADFFKIKNKVLRNKSIEVNYRGFYKGEVWQEFLKSFILAESKVLYNTNILLDLEFEGFILMYNDIITDSKVIIIDTNKIIELLSE